MTTRSRWSSFLAGPRARSGIAAVEFALIVPILLLLTLGIVDTCRSLIAYRKLTQMTQSMAWAAKTMLVPSTSKTLVSLPSSGTMVLQNIIFVTQGAAAPSNLAVSVRYLVKSMRTSALSETVLYQTQTAPTSDNSGIDTNLMGGDSRIVVQSRYQHMLLFGILGTSITLSARYSV
jgi:Flp pilus assembly protein TadG